MSISENSTVREPNDLLDEHSFKMDDLTMISSGKSPYTDQTLVALDVGPARTRFLLHRTFLEQSPELSAKADSFLLWSDKTKVIQLPDLEEATAHTLVHYLYTGAFQILRSDGQLNEDMLEGFKLGTCVYCAATRYKIPGLANLAKDKIAFCGDSLSILDILIISRESAFPVLPEEEAWFPAYLETAINDAFSKDPELFSKPEFSDQIEGDRRYRQVVVKAMMTALARGPVASKDVSSEEPKPAVEATTKLSPNRARHDSGTAEPPEDLSSAVKIDETLEVGVELEDAVPSMTETSNDVEPVFDAIEPVEELHAKPEPVTDETGWGKSTTYQNMGNMGKKPKKDSISDDAPVVPETETAVLAPEVVERQESQASNDTKPSVDVPNAASPESITSTTAVFEDSGAQNDTPSSKKSRKKKKKAQAASVSAVVA